MATTAPPNYDAAMAQLDTLQKQGLTADEKLNAQQKVAEVMADQATVKDLMDEIVDLSKTTVQMDKDFYKVYVALGQVDTSGYIGTDGKALPKLQPTWKGFKDRWVDLLWGSRNTATMTEVYMQDFDQVILPMVEDAIANPSDFMKYEDARLELDSFIKRRNPFANIVDSGEASSHSQGFTDLAREMLTFKDTFDDFTKKQQQAVEAQMSGLKQQINAITIEIQQCDRMVVKLGATLGITLFATGVGAIASLVALGPLGPCVAIKVLIIGAIFAIGQKIALVNYQNRSRQLTQQLRAKEEELRKLQEKLDTLKKIQALLEAQKSTISDIAARMSRFAVIWSAVNHDCVELRERFLNLQDPVSMRGLAIRIRLLKNTYQPLMRGLKLYATAVDNAGVTKNM